MSWLAHAGDNNTVSPRFASAAARAELRDRDAGQREADDDDLLALELHGYLSFSVPSASNASSAEISQNRTMIFGSSQPILS